MRYCLLLLIIIVGCHPKTAAPDKLLPALQNKLRVQNDSLNWVRPQVIRYANVYINDNGNKAKEDSMNYWSHLQNCILDGIAETKFLIDSLQREKR